MGSPYAQEMNWWKTVGYTFFACVLVTIMTWFVVVHGVEVDTQVRVPRWIIPTASIGLSGFVISLQWWFVAGHRWRYRRRQKRHPGAWWMWDHDWDANGIDELDVTRGKIQGNQTKAGD